MDKEKINSQISYFKSQIKVYEDDMNNERKNINPSVKRILMFCDEIRKLKREIIKYENKLKRLKK